MESYDDKLNSNSSACNSTYAQVLSKGRSDVKEMSTNNTSQADNDKVNGNENLSSNLESTDCVEKEALEINLSENSYDDYDTAEDSYMLSSSSSTVKSELMTNAGEENSSLTTGNSDESKLIYPNNDSQSEYSESGNESDVDEAMVVDELDPSVMKWRLRSNDATFDLPETVTVLETEHGSKVFLVGTAHFSKESQEDVAKTIRAVKPDVVMIELCKSRVNILTLDEETILRESETMNFQKMRAAVEQNGFLQGTLYLLMLNMSAHLTKQLGMAPGGEFRRAFEEAKQIPGCLVHLGDRPIHITLQRALSCLSLWQKIRGAWYMLRSKDPISIEEVERCKQKDLLEEMLAEMTGEFPELSRVFVKERDAYLTYSLQLSASSVSNSASKNGIYPSYVVGVVGIGHVPGIKENWGKISDKDIAHLLIVPEPSLKSKIIRRSIKYSFIGLAIYGAYRLCPKFLLPTKILGNIFKR